MPLGLDGPVWSLMGEGVNAINRLAAWVATWPGAQIHVPPMATWAITLAAFGLLLICLWRGRLRWLGVIPVVIAISQPWLTTQPDLIIDESGRVHAISDASGRMAMQPDRRDRFVRSVIKDRYDESTATWPASGLENKTLGLGCDAQGCVLNRHKTTATLALSAAALTEDCAVSDVIIAPLHFADDCRGSVVIDRGDLFRQGAHAIYLNDGRARIQTVEDVTGDRLWSRQPPSGRRAPPANSTRTEDAGPAD